MPTSYNPRPGTLTVIDGKIFINAKSLPPLPNNKKVRNPVILGDNIYIDGYEWRGHRWKRTLSAFLVQFLGLFII